MQETAKVNTELFHSIHVTTFQSLTVSKQQSTPLAQIIY